MAKLTAVAVQKLRALEDCLAHYSIETDNLRGAMEGLRDLLESDKAFFYALGQRDAGADLTITREASAAPSGVPWRETFDDYLRGRGVAWGAYNALRPEPAQRDCVLRSDELAVLTQGKSVEVEKDLLPRLGMLGHDTMRVLVCDGPSMLGWVGIIQPTPTTERQRELFERVVPAFRKRLDFERLVAQSRLADAALVMALEEIAGAAWVVGPNGRIEYANAAGRARLDGDREAVRASVVASIEAPAASPDRRFKVARVRDAAASVTHIVVETPEVVAQGNNVWDAVKRLRLTPAQTRVFEHVARGASNATIAAELGVAERTVEAHVTAILVKAQVPSRAALIVQIFKGHRATSAVL
jgi:DNA-binding CsgD family transcriptional regulator